MARRKKPASDLNVEDQAAYLAFREAQLGRLLATEKDRSCVYVRDLPVEAQERFIAARLNARRLWAGPNDWSDAFVTSADLAVVDRPRKSRK